MLRASTLFFTDSVDVYGIRALSNKLLITKETGEMI